MIKRFLKKHKRLLNLANTGRRIGYRYLFAIKRRQLVKKYFKCHQILKLQLGSGPYPISGWLNTDIDVALSKEVVFLDASKKFPFDDCKFSYVYCEHFIEHLEYDKGLRLVQECYRILKPGGKFRIATPDLNFLVELYHENKTELQKRYIAWAVKTYTDFGIYSDTFAINNFFRLWGHKFIYDFKTLKEMLERSGFMNITECRVGESDDENLQNLESHAREIGAEFNYLESLVIEATKPTFS
jgi:predicted SAM-dependent methyltransferase